MGWLDKYKGGGQVDDGDKYTRPVDPALEAMSKVLTMRNQDLNWVKRGMDPDGPGIKNKNSVSSHRLAYNTGDEGEAYVYPTIIQQPDGKLKELEVDEAWRYADSTRTAMRIPSVKLAEYYSQNGLIKHADGGKIKPVKKGELLILDKPKTIRGKGVRQVLDGGGDVPPTELTGPVIRGKQYPAGTIVTNDVNDPRLKAYQDSLYSYNTSVDIADKIARSLADGFRKENLTSEYFKEHPEQIDEVYNHDLKFYSEALTSNVKNPTRRKGEGGDNFNIKGDTYLGEDMFGEKISGSVSEIMSGYQDYLREKLKTRGNNISIGNMAATTRHNMETEMSQLKRYNTMNKNIKPTHMVFNVELAPLLSYKKPVQPVVFEDRINPLETRGFSSPVITPNYRVMPDVIRIDPMQHPAYRGLDISHQTDEKGRWVARMNKSTTPGVKGRLSTPNPKGNHTVKYDLGGDVPPLVPIYKSMQQADAEINQKGYDPRTGDRMTYYQGMIPGPEIVSTVPVKGEKGGYRSDKKSMREDLLNTSPTLWGSVPRQYDKWKIADRITHGAPAVDPSTEGLINIARGVAELPQWVAPIPFAEPVGKLLGKGLGHVAGKIDEMVINGLEEKIMNSQLYNAKNFREVVGNVMFDIPVERKLSRLPADRVRALRQVQEIGRLGDTGVDINTRVKYAMDNNLPEEDFQNLFGFSRHSDKAREVASNAGVVTEPVSGDARERLLRSINDQPARRADVARRLQEQERNIDPARAREMQEWIERAVENTRNNMNLHQIIEMNPPRGNFKVDTRDLVSDIITSTRRELNEKAHTLALKHSQAYPYHDDHVREKVSTLFLDLAGSSKGVSKKVISAPEGIASGEVFTGSMNTSHSSYLPQLKQVFKYDGGSPMFLGYKRMNDLGYLSQKGYDNKVIADYMNSEIDNYIKRGLVPPDIQRPFLRKGEVALPQYGIKKFENGGNTTISTGWLDKYK